MELYLMRHGAYLSKSIDPEKPLSPVGREQVGSSAKAVSLMGIGFDVMVSSTVKRAVQSVEIVAEEVGYPKQFIAHTPLLEPLRSPEESISYLKQLENNHSVFIMGHMPNLAALACHLLSAGSEFCLEMDTAGLIRIDLSDFSSRHAILRYHTTAHQLHLMAC